MKVEQGRVKMTGGAEGAEIERVIAALALEAGARIMEVRRRGELGLASKSDASPVTEADLAADRVIAGGLARAFPDIPAITEESCASHGETGHKRFFLVDPLDGTKDFVRHAEDFTVNIALIEGGAPVAGVVYAPAKGRLWATRGDAAIEARVEERIEERVENCAEDSIEEQTGTRSGPPAGTRAGTPTSTPAGGITIGTDAGRTLVHQIVPGSERPIHVRKPDNDALIIVASKSHRDRATDAFIARFNVAEFCAAGSSLKFCLLASGEADFYPRLGRTMEWDTAAGHAVLNAAGGSVIPMNDRHMEGPGELTYGKPGWENPCFLAIVPGIDLERSEP